MLDLDKLTGFTEGPWSIHNRGEFNVVGADKRRTICSTGGYSESSNSERVYYENIANARLIAAAPELLEMARKYEKALRLCLNFIENTESEIGIKLPCGDAAREALGDPANA